LKDEKMNAYTNTACLPLVLVLAFGASALPLANAHACACCGTYRVVDVADDDALNVRSGPGPGYGVVASLPPDEGCIIQTGQRVGSWVRIEAQSLKGWVNRRYLEYIR
jgi:uncharacterized protein YraI